MPEEKLLHPERSDAAGDGTAQKWPQVPSIRKQPPRLQQLHQQQPPAKRDGGQRPVKKAPPATSAGALNADFGRLSVRGGCGYKFSIKSFTWGDTAVKASTHAARGPPMSRRHHTWRAAFCSRGTWQSLCLWFDLLHDSPDGAHFTLQHVRTPCRHRFHNSSNVPGATEDPLPASSWKSGSASSSGRKQSFNALPCSMSHWTLRRR